MSLGGEAKQIAASGDRTCAVLTSGALRCWGSGANGVLGRGNTDNIGDNEVPSSVAPIDVGGPVQQAALGAEHACALLTAGTVRCWGSNEHGKLGYGHTALIGDNEAPASAGDVSVGGVVRQIAAGGSATCALLATGAVRCWGFGSVLGYMVLADIGDNELPDSEAREVNAGGAVEQLTMGNDHTCVLLTRGAVRCWGDGRGGALGYGNKEHIGDDEPPASASDVPLL